MIPLEKLKILTPLQKLHKNAGNFGKIIDSTGFEKLPKVQLIPQSGHTAQHAWKSYSSFPACHEFYDPLIHNIDCSC